MCVIGVCSSELLSLINTRCFEYFLVVHFCFTFFKFFFSIEFLPYVDLIRFIKWFDNSISQISTAKSIQSGVLAKQITQTGIHFRATAEKIERRKTNNNNNNYKNSNGSSKTSKKKYAIEIKKSKQRLQINNGCASTRPGIQSSSQ